MIPQDQAERDRALTSRRNVAVTAGAGTGKTTLLVSKLLSKVIDEKVDLGRILALTFTEKAANEMLDRVRRELSERGFSDGIDRAEIGTIHSFCAHVLRQFPIEAGVVPDFKVDEGEAFRRLFERAWPRWLDRELGADSPRPRAWREVLQRVDLATLRELSEGLASFTVPEEWSDGQATLSRLIGEAAREAPDLERSLVQREPPPKRPRNAGPAAASALRLAKDLGMLDDRAIDQALGLVSRFAREFRLDYLRAGYVSFSAMISLVHDLLRSREFPNVRELLREKYAYILVDEFQDTDPLQVQIIERLAEDGSGRLRPGKLFLVGDPKQSIYSFRGADIVAYRGAVDRILAEGGERVVLRTNFRSHGGILEFVNAVFSAAIKERGPLQPPYEPIEPPEGRAPKLPAPHLELILIEGADAEESREAEGEEIAQWIRSHHPQVAYRDVAILFKALSDVPLYIEALRSRGIPYVVHGEKYFYRTSEVIDFINLLRAVSSPHDRIALAAVLRSPYGSMSDQALFDRRKALDYREPGGVPILEFLRRWHEHAGRSGVLGLIDRIFEESFALEIARAGYQGEQAVANLLKLRQKAAEMESQGGSTLREFLEVAGRAVLEMEEEGESPLSDETLDAVTILSIHRAKGLEYPVVILPDLHRRSGQQVEPAVRFDWPTRTLGIRLGKVCNAGGAALAYLDRERRREEEKRLLYVAATRAKEALILLGSAKAEAHTYLGLLRPELEKRAKVTLRPYAAPGLRGAPPAPSAARPDWSAFVSLWRERERRARVLPPRVSPTGLEGGEEGRPAEFPRAGRGRKGEASARARWVGEECHRVLEQLDFSAPRVPKGLDPESGRILRAFFRTDAFRGLARSRVLARELPFLYRRGLQIVQGTIDLLYRDGQNLWVADYKTDKLVAAEEYRLIREIYVEAVRRVLGDEPRFKLIYLRHGREVEI
jgi:ATP-dependent helicase/nuclease subunit A